MTKKKDHEKKKIVAVEMLQPIRYKPKNLNKMAEDTKFTKSTVKTLQFNCNISRDVFRGKLFSIDQSF